MSERSSSRRSSHVIEYLLLAAVLWPLGALAVNWWLGRQVEQSVPAGSVLHVSSAGSLTAKLLIETESAYYPLFDLIVVEKGSPLILQKRGNGDWYLCDARTQVCARTSGRVLKNRSSGGAR